MCQETINEVGASKSARPDGQEARRELQETCIAYYARHPEEIEKRLAELDCEWDSSQAAATVAAGTCLASAALTVGRKARWSLVPLLGLQALVLGHAIAPCRSPFQSLVSWCGVRTRKEIEAERYALKAQRGGFQNLPASPEARGVAPVLEAVTR